MPAAQAEFHGLERGARGSGQRQVLVAAIRRVARARRKARAVQPRDAEGQVPLLTAESARDARAPRVVVAETRLRAQAGVVAAARDHVDHAADRVRAVERRARALDDLDALDQLGRDVLDRGAADGAGVDAQPVHQHQHVVRLRAAQEQRGLLARPAEARHLDARARAQHVAQVGGGLALELGGRNDLHIRQHAIRGNLRAGRRDDDGAEGLGGGRRRRQDQGNENESGVSVHRCSSRAGGYECLTGRSPDSRRIRSDRPHRLPTGDSGSGCRQRLRDAACAVHRCGGSAGMASDSLHRLPVWPGLAPGHPSSPVNVGSGPGAVKRALTAPRARITLPA